MSKKTEFFIVTAVKTSNLTQQNTMPLLCSEAPPDKGAKDSFLPSTVIINSTENEREQ
jgi:hypothetical protein